MSASAKIIEIAKTWEGTPYHHHQRLKGVGVDCAQLVAGVAIEAGLVRPDIEVENYSREWHMHNEVEKLCAILENFGCVQTMNLPDTMPRAERKAAIALIEPASILAFKFGLVVSHLGIYLGGENRLFIQAEMHSNRVVINTLSAVWERSLRRVYRFPTEI